ncbi:glucose 1-dehydrogenase [bacterium]|nr:glucose 1-dehydrogenase [bacterium]
MKAVVVLANQPQSLHLAEVAPPEPSPGEVQVKVLEVGLCGTDRDIVQGKYGEPPPGESLLVIGHENLGVVSHLGEGVTAFSPGELVVATVRRPCPELCLNCQAGEPDMCRTGNFRERGIKGLSGFATEAYVEQARYLVRIPERLRRVAVLLEPLSVVEKALREAWFIQERLIWRPERAFVTGAGPIGLLSAMVLRLKGLEVHLLDRVAPEHPKARLAQALGASFHHADAHHGLGELSASVGRPDVIVEATGVSSLSFPAVLALSCNGILVRLGLSPSRQLISLPGDVINQTMVLENILVLGSVNANVQDFDQGIADMLACEQRFPGWLEGLITRRLPLSALTRAFEREPDDVKVVLEVAATP